MIDYRVRTLLTACEQGSFVAAAKALCITQPAVSQQIRSLEEELGVRVFDRGNGKLMLTPQGELVLRCAKKMAGLESMLREDLKDSVTMADHLIIGITHTAESNPIAEALARFCAENPGFSIKIITDSISNLYSKLITYELDLAIVTERREEEDLRFLQLDTDYMVVAVSPTHPFAKRNIVTLDELKRERMILRLPNSATRNQLTAHLESLNMSVDDFNVILEVDNLATIKDLIRRDFGVSILPKSVCLDEIRKKKMAVLPIENLSVLREFNIAYRTDFSHMEILKQIVRYYNETLKNYKII